MGSAIAWLVLSLGVLFAISEMVLGWVSYKPGSRKGADRGTLPLMVGLTSTSTAAALATWYLGIGRPAGMPTWLPALGLALFAGGVILRWWAILTLRRHFTINVAALDEHRLITHGPYRMLRHPAYTGTLLTLCGLGVALGNPLTLALLVAGPLVALVLRMGVEEAMLESLFGDAYCDYRRRTWRLVPGIY